MFRFKKRFGQNFLVNEAIIEKITDSFSKFNAVFEIGPGHGALTKSFLAKNISVTALDIDIECVQALNSLLQQSSHLTLIHADILNYELPSEMPIVGNLPYNISSKIVEKIVLKTVPYAVFMFQKELAQVLTGIDYGKLTIFAQARYSISKLCDVKPGSFIPIPKVHSQVVVFERIDTYLNVDLNLLNKVLSLFFLQRRKMIRSIIGKNTNLLNAVIEVGIDISLRPENVSKELFYKLVLFLEKQAIIF